jgi:hypothetical protein
LLAAKKNCAKPLYDGEKNRIKPSAVWAKIKKYSLSKE